ncbi:uncharacterized protein [Aegilops tauschii subsp. strangulata]|uniref:uncharacterized protein n=1 Tax=Aegilops tauschii subsp. strangulata TaxID=200361 RepID=UPI003CC85843
MCSRLDEDGGHIFLRCKAVRQVWRQLDLEEIRLQFLELPNAMAVVQAVCSLSDNTRSQVAVLLWDWWTARKKVNAGDKARSTGEVVSLIQRHLLDFSPTVPAAVREAAPVARWEAPSPDFVKVNFDAALHQDTRDGAYGFVLRSDEGDVIAAGAGKLMHIKSALQAEAEACIAAIEGAGEAGVHRVVFESDCLSLVQALNTGESDGAELGVLFREAHNSCSLRFEVARFVQCPRACNHVAHSLAQFGFRMEVPASVWTKHFPDFIVSLVASDSAAPVG